jgi:4-amino-4-deoxy-L-arabinose transferase-like glycosyltransferase
VTASAHGGLGPFSGNYARARRLLLGLLVAYVVVLTLVAMAARPGAVWDDMLEAWAWGKELQLGYYKHPPFYSWVVGLWFKVFPRTDLAFYVLSALNIVIGLAGVWRLSGLLLRKYARLAAVSLLMFAPSYHYAGMNLNANSIQLSLWPWAAYFFVASLQTLSWSKGVAFGILCGCALLSKYYSILFVASCLASALVHPARGAYFRSAAPYCAIAACMIVVAPHAMWALHAEAGPIDYALARSNRPIWHNMYHAVGAAGIAVAVNALASAVLLMALGRRWYALLPRVWAYWTAPERRWLVVLAFGPILATMLLGLVGYVKIAASFMLPAVYILPLMIVAGVGPALTFSRVRAIVVAAALFMVATLAAAPVYAWASVALRLDSWAMVSPDVARAATQAWHDTQGTRPLRLATGSETFSLAMPFYSKDSPSEFTHYSFPQAPWVSRERIAREGIVWVCATNDGPCLEQANAFQTPETTRVARTFQKRFLGAEGATTDVVIFVIPPHAR